MPSPHMTTLTRDPLNQLLARIDPDSTSIELTVSVNAAAAATTSYTPLFVWRRRFDIRYLYPSVIRTVTLSC